MEAGTSAPILDAPIRPIWTVGVWLMEIGSDVADNVNPRDVASTPCRNGNVSSMEEEGRARN
ncbi:hypothetical protein PR003_g19794 [Phytophthora rubi]|uniref:Uncharacterized protein n=1 Tax=Phytophthora rubi TaxID=129364 RepID=A0A6A4DSU6_9STRA|nr:hypothetical protein PR003_g19794 [Phytophthora rubi]